MTRRNEGENEYIGANRRRDVSYADVIQWGRARVLKECDRWLAKSLVGRLHFADYFDKLGEIQNMHSNESLTLRYIEDDMVLISSLEERDDTRMRNSMNEDFWAMFYDVRAGEPFILPGFRLTWGLRQLVSADLDTILKKNIDNAGLLIKTPSQLPIQYDFRVKINKNFEVLHFNKSALNLAVNSLSWRWGWRRSKGIGGEFESLSTGYFECYAVRGKVVCGTGGDYRICGSMVQILKGGIMETSRENGTPEFEVEAAKDRVGMQESENDAYIAKNIGLLENTLSEQFTLKEFNTYEKSIVRHTYQAHVAISNLGDIRVGKGKLTSQLGLETNAARGELEQAEENNGLDCGSISKTIAMTGTEVEARTKLWIFVPIQEAVKTTMQLEARRNSGNIQKEGWDRESVTTSSMEAN
ncbi:hypothetical protein Fmac_007824 [Flemingia macrophylla]|uniref:Uncharacterized protein n=1 Tax=Flemingia macrophylla TaxID=520843 RepID=A0ABD1MVQ5_9FABA